MEIEESNVDIGHEATVSKVGEDQLFYLMTRGLTEEEAVGMIVRGFLDVGIQGIPDELKADIDDTIAKIGESTI
jgi:Fe-S cluster assembly scaffold protein SufB